MEAQDGVHADIPDEFKELRACLRCTLIKTFTQVDQCSPFNWYIIELIDYSFTIMAAKIANLWTCKRILRKF
jgi:hypothetical protein